MTLQVVVLEEFYHLYKSEFHKEGEPPFKPGRAYPVFGFESYSETGAGFVILVNEYGEIWWVNNQHVRAAMKYQQLM